MSKGTILAVAVLLAAAGYPLAAAAQVGTDAYPFGDYAAGTPGPYRPHPIIGGAAPAVRDFVRVPGAPATSELAAFATPPIEPND